MFNLLLSDCSCPRMLSFLPDRITGLLKIRICEHPYSYCDQLGALLGFPENRSPAFWTKVECHSSTAICSTRVSFGAALSEPDLLSRIECLNTRKRFPYGAGIRDSGTWRRELGRLEPLPGAVRNCMRLHDLACELPFDCVNLNTLFARSRPTRVTVDKFRIDLPVDWLPFRWGFDNDHLGTLMTVWVPSTPSFPDGAANELDCPGVDVRAEELEDLSLSLKWPISREERLHSSSQAHPNPH